jgi:hypothetical protein
MSELPEKLDIVPLPLCSAENEKNEIAIKYNNLNSSDPKRKKLYENWKEADERAFMD